MDGWIMDRWIAEQKDRWMMDTWMDDRGLVGWMDELTEAWMDGWTGGQMDDGQADGWIEG